MVVECVSVDIKIKPGPEPKREEMVKNQKSSEIEGSVGVEKKIKETNKKHNMPILNRKRLSLKAGAGRKYE